MTGNHFSVYVDVLYIFEAVLTEPVGRMVYLIKTIVFPTVMLPVMNSVIVQLLRLAYRSLKLQWAASQI